MIDGQVKRHHRRFRARTKVAGVTIGLAVLTLTFLAYSFYPLFQRDSFATYDSASATESALLFDNSNSLPPAEKSAAPQVVFPYSVIPGGARSSRELLEAVRREAVVASHYAEFSVARAHVMRLPRDKSAYVSYRLGSRIYWTKTKVNLRQGETVLSDAQHLARTRCGNRISDVPMTPVSPHEPEQKLMSTPFVPAHVDVDPVFVTNGPTWPDHPTSPILMAMHDMPPTSNLGPGFALPPFLQVFCCGGKSSASPPSSPTYPLPQPGYPPPAVTTPEPGTFLLLLSSLVLLPLLIHSRRIH